MIGCLILIFPVAPVHGADTDDDGLDDDWETTHGLNSSDPSDGDGAIADSYGKDADGDGIIDDQEDKVEERFQPSLLDTFFVTGILAFAVILLIAGPFVAYFGAGKTRGKAGVMSFIAIGILITFVWTKVFGGELFGFVNWPMVNVTLAFLTVLAAFIGIVIALGIFYKWIMS